MAAESWHLDEWTVRRYTAGRSEPIERLSAESHLLTCERCRGALELERGQAHATRWQGVLDRIDRPQRRLATRTNWLTVSVSNPLLCVTSLGLASALVLAVAAVALLHSVAALPFLLAVAPLAPAAGAAVAFRPTIDPAGALSIATPMATARLPFLRAGFATAAATVAGLAAAAITPLHFDAVTVWLLPGLALSAVVAATATFRDPLLVCGAACSAWVLLVARLTAERRPNTWSATVVRELAIARPAVQLSLIAVCCVAMAICVARRDARPRWRTA